MKWLREALTDENGVTDVAYVSIFMVTLGILAAIAFICIMSAISYFTCYHITDVGLGQRAQVPCTFDPQPVGVALAAVCTAFAAMVGALAGYMAATRRREKDKAP